MSTNAKRFAHPAPTIDKVELLDPIAEKLTEVADMVEQKLPVGREASLVYTKLEEAMMWARKAVAN